MCPEEKETDDSLTFKPEILVFLPPFTQKCLERWYTEALTHSGGSENVTVLSTSVIFLVAIRSPAKVLEPELSETAEKILKAVVDASVFTPLLENC